MSRTWKRPEGHGRGVGDWRGKGMEYAHDFRPSRHIGSFRDYYSGNYGYDDDTRFEYAIPRGRVSALGASPNEDRPSRGRIRPNFDSHLRSRSGMRDKGIRRDFERDRFYDDEEFAPKSDLFYDDDNSLDDDVLYEGEEERQPDDYFFYLMKCRGDRKKVFTHALAVDKKANDTPEDISDYVNDQLNSNPNLTSKYGSSIKILKVTLCSDYNKWYRALNENGIDLDDVIWVEDEPSTDVEEDIHAEENSEETVDMEAADFNYGDDADDSSDISFDEFRGFVSEYVNMLIDYNKDGNIGSYSNIMNALKDANYRYINDCPCYDFVASESWDEWESYWKHFDDVADEAIEVLTEIFLDIYDDSEMPSITAAEKKTLIQDMYGEIEDYLHEKLGGPYGEENEEFELHPGTFEDLEEGVSEYINGIIEFDDRDDTLIDSYDHIEKALNARGYSYTKYCPCKDLVKCRDISDYNFFYKDFKKEAVEAINLCMDMLPDVYDGVTVDSITPQQEKELINKIHDQIWEYLQLKFEDPSPRKSEDWLEDDGIYSDSGEENEEFETRPADFLELKGCIEEYLATLIEYDIDPKTTDYENYINALKKMGYKYMDECPCMRFVKSRDSRDWTNISKEVDRTIELCKKLITEIDNETSGVEPITRVQYDTLYDLICDTLEAYLEEKARNYKEDGFESDDTASYDSGEDMDTEGYINTVEYQSRF